MVQTWSHDKTTPTRHNGLEVVVRGLCLITTLFLTPDRLKVGIMQYSESSVIRTSIIQIVGYPDHKITLHMTRGLRNYHTNAQYASAFSVARVFSLL